MKLFIVLLCITAVFAGEQRSKIHRNLIRNNNQQLGNSESSEENDEKLWNSQNRKGLQANDEAFPRDVGEDGVWIDWDESRMIIPLNAVFGGIDGRFTYFVMRAEHILPNGTSVGKIVGSFEPNIRTAQISFMGESFRKSRFELLLHERHVWVHRSDRRPKIPGGNGFICRSITNNGRTWLIGDLNPEGNLCLVSINNRENSFMDFEFLAHSCRDSNWHRASPAENSMEPVIVSKEEYEENRAAYNKNLHVNPVWIIWNNNLPFVMTNSVFGGYDANGAYFLTMVETEHMDRIPGMYQPATQRAVILSNDLRIVSNFNLMLHESSTFTSSWKSGTPITVAPHIAYCKSHFQNWQILPGRVALSGGQLGRCQLFHPTSQLPDAFHVLRNAC